MVKFKYWYVVLAVLVILVVVQTLRLNQANEDYANFRERISFNEKNAQAQNILIYHNANLAYDRLNQETQVKLNAIQTDYNDAIASIDNDTQRMYYLSEQVSKLSSENNLLKARSMGNATAIELPRDVGKNIQVIRKGTREDHAKIVYLQNYIIYLEGIIDEYNKGA